MAYSDYSFSKLKQRFGIGHEAVYLFKGLDIAPKAVSIRLLKDIAEAEQIPLLTEKAKSEYLIAPILKELKRNNPNLSFFSGYTFNIDASNELVGAPDYLISKKPRIV